MTRVGEDAKKSNKSGGRSARLAAALRENLRRRKTQERKRGAGAAAGARTKSPHDDKDG
jgi:hypothetical protein